MLSNVLFKPATVVTEIHSSRFQALHIIRPRPLTCILIHFLIHIVLVTVCFPVKVNLKRGRIKTTKEMEMIGWKCVDVFVSTDVWVSLAL